MLDQSRSSFCIGRQLADLNRLYALAKLCQSIEWYDEDLALDLVEHSLGPIKKAFIDNPLKRSLT